MKRCKKLSQIIKGMGIVGYKYKNKKVTNEIMDEKKKRIIQYSQCNSLAVEYLMLYGNMAKQSKCPNDD